MNVRGFLMKNAQERMSQISIPVSAALLEAMRAAAHREDRPVASWVRRQIAHALEASPPDRTTGEAA
jgi:hypothetical protein